MGQINIRIDDRLRRYAEKVLRPLGLSHSDAIRIYYHRIVNTRGIPFELSVKEPSETILSAMQEVQSLRNKKNVKKYTNVKKLMADLDV